MKRRKLLGVLLLVVTLLMGEIGAYPITANAASSTTITVSVKHPKLDTIKLKWSEVTGANGYNVYISLDAGKNYQLAGCVNNTAMVFDNLTRNKVYYFKVVAFKKSGSTIKEFLSSSVVKSNSNRIGIDVSHWQNTIDWAKVKNAGIEFAIIKASGTSIGTHNLYTDSMFKTNIQKAIEVKMPVGVYHYSGATTEKEAQKEAKYILSLIKGYKITYPVVIDYEADVQKKLSKATGTKVVNAFCKVIKDAGYKPMVYSGCNFSQNYLNIDDIPYDLWIAHYSSNGSVVNNDYHYNSPSSHYPYTRMWQYSSSNIPVDGIKGNVDRNYEFDIKESVKGYTHIDMKTGVLTYIGNSSDTLETVANKNVTTKEALLEKNPNVDLNGGFSGIVSNIDAVSLSTSTMKLSTYKVGSAKISWTRALGAYNYIIQRSTSEDGTYSDIATLDSMTLSYIDTTPVYGQTYYYRVVAVKNTGSAIKKSNSNVISFKSSISPVKNLKAAGQNYNTIKLTWDKVNYATGYTIKYATSKNGTYKTLATVNTTSYSATGLNVGQTYYFKVYTRFKDSTGNHAAGATTTSAYTVVGKPKSLAVSKTTYNSVSLTWKASSDAQKYYVYRSTKSGSGYVKIGNTKATTFKDTTAKTGTTYYYKIVAYRTRSGKVYQSGSTGYVKAKPALAKAAIAKIAAGSKKLTVSYKKVAGASGYEIYQATSKNGTYKKIATTKATSYTNKSLKKKATYYYKVRAYRTVSGKKVYGAFSPVKSMKTK